METTAVSITAKDVMALRKKTGLGMMDCKKALAESNGDMDAAAQWLRRTLKGKMAQRSDRVTGEGLIGIAVDGPNAAIVEIRTETDFTARNEEFVAMVGEVVKLALSQSAGEVRASEEITGRIDEIRIKTGENVQFARGQKLEGGRFGTYLHHDGKRAAVIQVEGEADEKLLTGICQHIVAHDPAPIGISEADVPAQEIQRVRTEALKEAEASGKPAQIVTKIADGKVRKYLQEKTLLDQMYVRDTSGKTPVRKVLGAGVSIKRFVRYTVGA